MTQMCLYDDKFAKVRAKGIAENAVGGEKSGVSEKWWRWNASAVCET